MNLSSAYIEKNASRLFGWLFVLQLVGWTLIPALFQPSAPLDVIEGFAWGREWVMGTYKHPPLQAWLLEIVYNLFGTSPVGYFGLSALCTAVALWAIYRTGRLPGGKTQGLLAAALAQSILYFNFLSPEFNPNVLLLALWALGGYAFSHALLRKDFKYWLLLAVVFALGFYAKYTTIILAASFGLFMLTQPEARQHFLRAPAWIAALVLIVLLIPHIDWLIEHQFLPFNYAATRAEAAKNITDHLLFPVKFTLSQLLALLPALLAAAVLLLPLREKTAVLKSDRYEERLIFWLAFTPLILVLVSSFISGEKLRDMWGMPFLSFIPLWLVTRFRIIPRYRFFTAIWGSLFILSLAAFAGNFLLAVPLGFKPLRGQFPGSELSSELHQRWKERKDAPLHYVVGDAWMAGNVAFYSPHQPRPHVWIDGKEETSQWIDPQKVKISGAVFVWRADKNNSSTPEWLDAFPQARKGKSFKLQWKSTGQPPPITIGWAWLPPAPESQ